MSDMPIDKEDPCDGIDLQNLDGWIRYDSSRMRTTNNESGMGSDQRGGHTNPWVRLGDD